MADDNKLADEEYFDLDEVIDEGQGESKTPEEAANLEVATEPDKSTSDEVAGEGTEVGADFENDTEKILPIENIETTADENKLEKPMPSQSKKSRKSKSKVSERELPRKVKSTFQMSEAKQVAVEKIQDSDFFDVLSSVKSQASTDTKQEKNEDTVGKVKTTKKASEQNNKKESTPPKAAKGKGKMKRSPSPASPVNTLQKDRVISDRIKMIRKSKTIPNDTPLLELLEYLDGLMSFLPKNKVEEFAKSKHFSLYSEIMENLSNNRS